MELIIEEYLTDNTQSELSTELRGFDGFAWWGS